MQFWNLESRQVIAAVHDDDEEIYSSTLAASPDGNTVAIGRFYPKRPSPIEIVCRVDGNWKLKRTLEIPRWPMSLCFSPDGKKLAAGAWDGGIVLWNVEDWAKLDDLAWNGGSDTVDVAVLFLAEFRSNVHQDPAQHVLSLAVSTVAPIFVVRGVLDDPRVTRTQQQLSQFVVLRELGHHGFAHDVDSC